MRNGSSASLRAVRWDGAELNETCFLSKWNFGSLVETDSSRGWNPSSAHGLRTDSEEADGTSLRAVQNFGCRQSRWPDRADHKVRQIPGHVIRLRSSTIVGRGPKT